VGGSVGIFVGVLEGSLVGRSLGGSVGHTLFSTFSVVSTPMSIQSVGIKTSAARKAPKKASIPSGTGVEAGSNAELLLI
jgi:hypothetical protein